MYGKVVGGVLVMSEVMIDGYKPIKYAPIPQFDQETQYVAQTAPSDSGDSIYVGVEIGELELDAIAGEELL